ncbi:MAG: DUF4870 domain-containing protein [Anaerolineae bacterium]|nr:DUF4870 domain-containing protein [Anaerolineae bacterium]MDW8098975.1 DUF4870 domain-containing protein [Anaerolineae bacterium]
MSEEERAIGPTGPEEAPRSESRMEPGVEMQPAARTSESGPTAPGSGVEVVVSDDDRLMAALAWASMAILQIPLISLVLLIVEENKRRPFQRFHAVNSLLFWIVGFFYEILAVIVYIVLTVITLGCLGLFLWVIFFLPHLVAFYYAYQAYQGRQREVPFLTDLARSQGWLQVHI